MSRLTLIIRGSIGFMKRLKDFLTSTIDSRSLGLFRIVIGLSLVYNIIFQRLACVGTLVNNERLIPHQVIDDYYGAPIPLFRLFTSDIWSYGYLIVLLLLAIGFTVGKLSWWLRLLTFFLFGIVNASYTYLSHGPEFLIETALFWSVLLPVNTSFVLGYTNKSRSIKSMVVTGFYIQLFLIYVSSWLLKDGAVWRSDQVMEILVHERIHATGLLKSLQGSVDLLRGFTAVGFWLEVIVSILILVAIKIKRVRLITAVSILILHTTMVLLLSVGHFWSIGLAFSCLFIPSMIFKNQLVYHASCDQEFGSIKTIFLGILVLFILHGNMFAWKKQGYLSDVIDSISLSEVLLKSHYKDPGMASGFYHQSWRFFSGDIPPDLGDFVYVGIDENGIEYELISGKKLDAISDFHFTNNHYHDAEFVFAVYLKFYQERFPASSLKEWLRIQVVENPAEKAYNQYKLYHHKRTFTVNQPIKINDALIELVTLSL